MTYSTENASSLRDFDRPDDRIRQHRQVDDGPIIIVEGPTDQQLLQEHLPDVKFFPVDGKVNVLRCLRQLNAWGIQKVIGITDRDFDGPNQIEPEIADMHMHYQGRDLEAMLIELGVLATTLEYIGSRHKLSAVGGAQQFIDRLRTVVTPIMRLRLHNMQKGWGLPFDEIDLAGKLERRTVELKLESYCAALSSHYSCDASIEEIRTATADDSIDDGHGPRGKDIVIAAGVGLRHLVGSLQQAATGENVLAAMLYSSSGLAISRSEWLRRVRLLLEQM